VADDAPGETAQPPATNGLLTGLREHRVYRVALGYAVGAWIILQVAAIVLPGFAAPPWVLRGLMILLALGFGAALLAGWGYDRRASGRPLMPRAAYGRLGWVVTALLPAALVATFFLLRPLSPPAAARVNRVVANVYATPVLPTPATPLAPPAPIVPEKSIAVLPFENLSEDKDNRYFTDGVQDEILTDLAKVTDLKVISRTSVMQYRDNSVRNLRDIAAQLGVAHVVEGSVQREGNVVRVNVQLINARTDAHEWATDFDKTLDNVFTVETVIAQAIADQLQAKISPDEHLAMAEVPTKDVLALQLYQQALEIENHAEDTDAHSPLLHAVGLLGEAIKRDPKFLSAWCLLSLVHLDLYWNGFDHTDVRRNLARVATDEAVRLQPDAPETYVALANYDYYALRDYDRALVELALVRRIRPNDPDVFAVSGAIHRRQGRWEETIREWARFAELDPRNLAPIQGEAEVYAALGRFPEAAHTFSQALKVSPSDVDIRENLALLAYCERADLEPSRALNAAILEGEPSAVEASSYFRLIGALAERDAKAARTALATFPASGWQEATNFVMPRDWFAGVVARTFGDRTGAQKALNAARAQVETVVRDQSGYAQAWSALGLIDAGLGHKEEAIREGRRACELLPVSKDAWEGPTLVGNLAEVYAWTGKTDLALQQLKQAAQLPSGMGGGSLYYGGLKCDPRWDPLRGDPRFAAMVASLAPKQKP
jgi:TolB-like protein/Flp pilus assembly protein TadD